MKTFIAKALVKAYFVGKAVEFKPESNGTIRYTVNGHAAQGFLRIRKIKSRPLALIEGDTFKVLHFGKLTFGVETGKVRDAHNFGTNA